MNKILRLTSLLALSTFMMVSCGENTTSPSESPSEDSEEYAGYMYFDFYRIDILKNDKSKHYLNPGIKDKDNQNIDVSDFPFTFTFDSSLVDVSKYGGISSKGSNIGSTVITCIYTVNPNIKASCTVNIVDSLPTKEKAWVRVDDYDSLSDGDVLVLASPEHGVTASLDTLHSKLNPVESCFSSDKKTITSLGEGSIEFVLGLEDKGMTLEAQTGEYLVCTHQGKVKLDASSKTNKYWDIHSNIDPEDGTGSIDDGAVIENNIESLGYIMFNIALGYFSTYVDNSISKYMVLPFLYRLQELN